MNPNGPLFQFSRFRLSIEKCQTVMEAKLLRDQARSLVNLLMYMGEDRKTVNEVRVLVLHCERRMGQHIIEGKKRGLYHD